MLLLLTVLGLCALLTRGLISGALWALFYGLLGYVALSLIIHWTMHLKSYQRPIPFYVKEFPDESEVDL